MSRLVGAEIRSQIISDENDLLDFCNFDSDLNGDNGEEFTMEEAIEAGFDSSAEYIFDVAKKTSDNFEDMIRKALSAICETDETYLSYEVIDLEDGRYVAIIATGINF